MNYTIREIKQEEYALLSDFLYEAIYIPEGVEPLPRSVLSLPELHEYIVDCGLSLGAILALDYAIRHANQVSSLILIGVQYKVATLLIDLQNLIFRCMPHKTFEAMCISKSNMIQLSHSIRSLDFRSK